LATPLEFFGSRGSLGISRSGFTVTADRKLPPENTVRQFAGAHPAGGPAAVEETRPPQFWTKTIADTSGDIRAQLKQHVSNFLDCIKTRREPISDLESGHRVATACHLANLSLRLGRRLRWDADKETILDDPEAAKMLVRPYRAPWDAELKALGVG
jgi:hypothetical protein